MKPRTYGAFALLPTGNDQGSVKFWKVGTGGVSTSAQFTILPLPQEAVDYMNELAKKCPANTDVAPSDVMFREEDEEIGVHDEVANKIIDRHLDDRRKISPVEIPEEETESLIEDDNRVPEENVEDTDTVLEPDIRIPEQEIISHDHQEDDYEALPPIVREQLEMDRPIVSRRDRMRAATDPLLNLRPREDRSFNIIDSYIFNMKIEEAMKVRPEEAEQSILNELKSIHGKGVIQGVKINDLTPVERKSILPSKLFLKEKFSPGGEFEKLKSRLVGGGHRQDRRIYEQHERSAPTLSTSALFTIAGIAAKRRWKRATCDVGTAYLNANLGEKHKVFMRINPKLSSMLCQIDESYKNYLNHDGTLVVQLRKALYGLIESANLWYKELSGTLIELGYSVNPFEQCVFSKTKDDAVVSIIGIFVDDIKIVAEDQHLIDEMYLKLVNKYKDVKIDQGDTLQYLGMVFDYSTPYEVSISMPKYIEELLESQDVVGISRTPATVTLYDIGDSQLLSYEQRVKYHSDTAKLLYLAKRIKPDILFALSYLTTRVKEPTVNDQEKLDRVIRYIRYSKNIPLRFAFDPQATQDLVYETFIDSSHGIHSDMRGHSGVCVTFGGGCILGKSTKHKINSKSSAESELIALSDHAGIAIHGQRFLKSLGIESKCEIYQDNTSTKHMISSVNVNDKSKHIKIRYYWLKERVRDGDVSIKYIPTKEMLADLMTKALQGEQFIVLRDRVMNVTKGCVGNIEKSHIGQP
jgi:hypothetical protein